MARPLLPSLLKRGKVVHGFLGVTVQDLTLPSIANAHAAVVRLRQSPFTPERVLWALKAQYV